MQPLVVGSNVVTVGRAGVVEVGGIMTAVGVHVGDVGFQFDVWVEVADVSKGLFPSIKGVVDSK